MCILIDIEPITKEEYEVLKKKQYNNREEIYEILLYEFRNNIID